MWELPPDLGRRLARVWRVIQPGKAGWHRRFDVLEALGKHPCDFLREAIHRGRERPRIAREQLSGEVGPIPVDAPRAPARLLVAEADRTTLAAMAKQLKRLPYQVVEHAATGAEAVAAIERFWPDLVLLDLDLDGEGSGIGIAEQILIRRNVSIVLIVGSGDRATLARAEPASACGYLLKPFTGRDLEAAVESALQRHRLERKHREVQRRLSMGMRQGRCHAFDWDVLSETVSWGVEGAEAQDLPPQRTVGTSLEWFQRVPPDDRVFLQRTILGLEPGADRYRITYRRIRPDGEEVILEESGRGFFDVKGRLIRVMGMVADVTSRERALQSLREANERLEAVADFTSNWEYWLGPEGRFHYVSPSCEQLTGYTRAEFLQDPELALRIVHPEDRPRVQKHLEKELDQPESDAMEFRIIRRDGAERWLSHICQPVFDPTGTHRGRRASHRDVTERRQAELILQHAKDVLEAKVRERSIELRSSLLYARSLIEASLDPLVTISREGKITDVNTATETVTGLERSALVGTDFADYFTEPDRARAAYLEAFREGLVRNWPLELRHRDGTVTPVLYNTTVYRSAAGEVLGVFAAARDVSDLKRAEEALEQESRRLYEVLDTLPAYVVLLSEDRSVPFANRFFQERFGDSTGHCSYECLLGDAQSSERREAYRVLQSNKPHRWEWTGPDGHVYDVYDYPFTDSDGSALLLEMGIDITGQRQAEEQLRQAQKMEAVGLLAGGVAHDFNNLLFVISGYCEMILSKLPKDGPWHREIQLIHQAGIRAAGLTRQLLAFSRKQVLAPKVLNLNELVFNLEKLLSRLLGEDIKLEFNPTVRLGNVKADPGQLEQVIMNLAVNARDAMPAGGRLVIRTDNVVLDEADLPKYSEIKAGAYVQMEIVDNGIGMDKETQSHIFEPFFTTKERGKGTGLGLSTVYGIIKQSGGHIQVSSEVGKGAAFTILLPCVDEPVKRKPSRGSTSSWKGRGETILLVEDEEEVRILTSRILSEAGYVVVEACNGEQALLLGEQFGGAIRLLLTDVVMPVMGGPELARRLTASWPAMQVLYISGYTDDTIIRQGILYEGTEFLSKPLRPEELLKKVRTMLRKAVPQNLPDAR